MNKLGIDIGSSTFKYVYLDENNNIIDTNYIFHKGKIKKYFNKLIKKLQNNNEKNIFLGISGALSNSINLDSKYNINNNVALIEGVLFKNKDINSIIELGAQETKYITDINKNNLKFFMNSSCAAGTGSFLEEQALRLSIDIKDISSYIEKATSIPRIAGRCSVFSKTDMIHHMQDGVKIEDILQGLCYALVRNYKGNVLQKNIINKPVMLSGGVMNNNGVVKALKDILNLKDGDFILDKDCELFSCFGACKIAKDKNLIISIEELDNTKNSTIIHHNENSKYKALGHFGKCDSKSKHICKNNNIKEGYLGIDIGSTSTNFVVIDDDNNVIDYIYTKTMGKPKDVVLENFEILKDRLGRDFKFKGIATTGSGREFIGKLVNADLIVNEITAQAEGATSVYLDVDTIFEIGGQDSKYISIEDKLVKDFEMNKICAAGTGAFIEEQIKKIGINLEDFGDIALKGDNPCDLGDRCTVFIEGNIGKAISQNESIENISAGLAYSIVKNYLTRVVGNRKIGNKILLQGGIAYNQGVVNAFRSILNKEIIVPRFFSVTGALGAATLVKNTVNSNKNLQNVSSEEVDSSDKFFLEGYITERDPDKKTIGIPRVLFLHKMFPMFNEIFKRLGYNVVLSDLTNEEIISLSQEYSFEETCFPVKLINGHVAYLIQKEVDYIFLPHLYTMKHSGSNVREDYACVYMQTSPKIVDSIFNLEEKGIKLISPTLSFNFGKEYMIKTLLSIGETLGENRTDTIIAVMAGMKKFFEYERNLERTGIEVLNSINEDEKVFVIISRAYNVEDPVLNMGIEDKLKSMGYKVLHLTQLEASTMEVSENYDNMYWPFGQHILTGAKIIKNHKNLYAVYITNHGCGPDTILSHYVKKELQGKPYLHLEVDEHSSKVGIITRVEAFVNSLNNFENKDNNVKTNVIEEKQIKQNDEEEIIIPHMYPYSNVLKAFLEKNEQKNVTILSPVNNDTIEYGKQFSRSKEYFSLVGLTAEVINKIKDNEKIFTLYMPTDEGSETFGQYGNFIKEKALEIGKNLNLKAPFIEDYLKDSDFGLEFYRALVICDLINLLDEKTQEIYLNKLLKYIQENNFDSEHFEEVVKELNEEIKKLPNKKKILIVGEPLVVYKDYLNNNKLKQLKEEFFVIKQPLSEVLYMTFNDFANKRNSSNRVYKKLLNEVKAYINYVNSVLDVNSPFNREVSSIEKVLKEKLDFYAGGSGRYRLGKALTAENVNGILMVSSMYENTATILKIIRDRYKENIQIPVIDLYFDSNINKNTDELLETFTAYL